MRRSRKTIEALNAINLTSLMDLTFVLLISFMIITPSLKHGIKIDLPKVNGENMSPKKSYDIIIKKRELGESESRVYLNDKRIDLDELVETLQANYERDPEIDVIIEADKDVLWDDYAKVLGSVKRAGVTNVGITTQPDVEESKD